jgi:hypothetical protein
MSDKLYRIAVILLLAGILGLLAYGLFKPSLTDECREAILDSKHEASVARSDISSLMNNYESEVYDRADNINQQLFLATEHIFLLHTKIAGLLDASTRVQFACQ